VQVVELAPRLGSLLTTERALAWLAGAFGVLAIILVVVGLYGVIAYLAVSRRTEIGVRLALGIHPRADCPARPAGFARAAGRGSIIGIPLAAAAMRSAGTLLFGMRPRISRPWRGRQSYWRPLARSPEACRRGARRCCLRWRRSATNRSRMWRTARVAVQRVVRDLTAGAMRRSVRAR
jgi:hypothetical protein